MKPIKESEWKEKLQYLWPIYRCKKEKLDEKKNAFDMVKSKRIYATFGLL